MVIGSGRILLAIGWMFQAFGLVVLVVGVWLEFTYILPSVNANVRGQAVQLFQVCHLLWPPFLFANLSRTQGRMIRARMEALIHNLPYA